MLINFSNHPSNKWSADQVDAALSEYASIMDIPFPAVKADASSEDVFKIAEQYERQIEIMHPSAVLCQGEFSLAFAVAGLLIAKGIKVICACSERDVVETLDENGETQKVSTFKFVSFREYILPIQKQNGGGI